MAAVTGGSDRLSTLAGVRPSPDWTRAFRSHLIDRGRDGDDEDAALREILRSDLRDVVRTRRRPGEDGGGGDGAAASDLEDGEDSPSRLVRCAISASLPPGAGARRNGDAPCKSDLPAGFRLLAQVEECLDVSLNAEARASVGPASPSDPTPVGNQRNRCLKMLLSDGYYGDGSGSTPPAPARIGRGETGGGPAGRGYHLVAMENSPIPDLSVHSRAGIKILLRGPVVVRFGVLMLNEGNVTVLGGSVPALVPVQRKAREMARRVAGVGVDPTIKALIWNADAGVGEEDDEAEEASGDVREAARPANPPPREAIVAAAGTAASGPDRSQTMRDDDLRDLAGGPGLAAGRGRGPAGGGGIDPPPRPQWPQNSVPPPEMDSSRQDPPNGLAHSAETIVIDVDGPSLATVMAAAATTAMTPVGEGVTRMPRQVRPPGRGFSANPYTASRNPYASSSKGTSSPGRGCDVRQSPTGSAAAPGARGAGRSEHIVVELVSPDPPQSLLVPLRTPSGKRLYRPAGPADPNYGPMSAVDGGGGISSAPRSSQDSGAASTDGSGASAPAPTPLQHLPASGPTPFRSGRLPASATLSPTALSVPVSFSELRSLLQRAMQDRSIYSSYEGRTFVVPAKLQYDLNSSLPHFNIEKVKGGKKKKGGGGSSRSYQYVMSCRFVGTSIADGSITCRVSTALLEPFMDITATDLRKLAKEDKAKGNAIVTECGKQIISEYCTLASCKMKLFLSAEEFFQKEKVPSEVDGNTPILLLCSRDDV